MCLARFLRSSETFDCDSEDTLLRDIRVNGMTLGNMRGYSMICFLLGPLLGIDQPTAAMMGVMEGLVEGLAVAMLHDIGNRVRLQVSALKGRDSNPSIAASTVSLPATMAWTACAIGMSMPLSAATLVTAAAV